MFIILGAQNVFMQTALATLTLRPQAGKLLLKAGHFDNMLLIDFGLSWLAVFAHGRIWFTVWQYCLATQACFSLLRKHCQATDFRYCHCLCECMLALFVSTKRIQSRIQTTTTTQKPNLLKSMFSARSPSTGSKMRNRGFDI
jgi:hypothetical protein